MLEIKNLRKSFGGIKAVNNCSFTIKPNKITALIGPNGSGKTTVFNLISGVYRADHGTISLDEQALSNLSVEQISNAGISRVFQHSRLFNNLTVIQNLSLALQTNDSALFHNIFKSSKLNSEQENQINAILTEFHIFNIKDRLASDISYGQKRLVELARAILRPHKILLLDEPVSGVHPEIRQNIANLLYNLKSPQRSIFLIEHDMTFTLDLSNHIIVMDAGKIIAEGLPKEIKENKQVLDAYLG
jgi:branched-chain amino acid transport system ATP-binding protein